MARRTDVSANVNEPTTKGQRVTDNNNGAKLKPAPSESPNPEPANPEGNTADGLTNADADGCPEGNADCTTDAPVDAGDDEHDDDPTDAKAAERPTNLGSTAQRRLSISVSARSLTYAALIAVLVGTLITFIWLYIDAQHGLNAQAHISANNAHAEKVALDYAVNAAAMNYQDLNGWKTRLVAGTSPELNDKLSKAAESMQQILIPLQWTSTARPLVAKVRSIAAGIYIVDCFVSVQTKTMQAPDPLMSTATYSLTLDSNKNWQITDVGGIGALTGQR